MTYNIDGIDAFDKEYVKPIEYLKYKHDCLICGKLIKESENPVWVGVCDECKEAIQYVKDNFPIHRTEDDPVVVGHSSDEKNYILHLSDGRTVSVPVDGPLKIMSENK